MSAGAVTVAFDGWFSLLLALAFVVVMAWASARVLGVRPGRWRGLLASVLGWLVGLSGAAAVTHRHSATAYYSLAVLFGLLATMVITIVLEAMVRPRTADRRRSRRGWLHPLRALRRAVAPVGRFLEVMRHARRHGLARPKFASADAVATADFGRRLRLTLEDAGGMFVKFGQIASTRSDLLAEPVIDELAELRSSVRPVPAELLEPLLVEELGCPVAEVFASFDWEPLAAASIGQTHRAVLFTGERVVVKIQRPGMEDLLRRDATVLRLAAAMAERRMPGARQLGLRELADELILNMSRELDYLREAAMSKRLSAGADARSAGAPDGPRPIGIPVVYEDLSTSTVLVMEEVQGRSVDDALAVQTCGVPRQTLARGLLASFIGQILQTGAYHADPHPGNVFVDTLGRLWLLDFGAVGLLDALSRQALQEIALGMTLGEPLLVARAVRRLGGSTAVELSVLEADISTMLVEADSGGQFDPRLMEEVLNLMARYGLRVPRAMSTLSRALLTLEGTLSIICPGFDTAAEATALVRAQSPAETEMGSDVLQHELLRAMPVLRGLPDHVDELATQLRAGRMSVRIERFAGDDEAKLDHWIDRVLITVVGASGIVAAAMLLIASGLAHSRDVDLALRSVGFIGLVLSLVLLMRTVAQVLGRRGGSPGR